MAKPLLHVIKNNQKIQNKKSLKEIIEERRLIKIKLKLIQIFYLDKDIIELDKHNFGLNNFNLDNIYLTEELGLYVPLKDEIIKKRENDKTLLNSYLIYLSYLYNFDFLNAYLKTPSEFYNIINELNISPYIKGNIYRLIESRQAEHFIKNIEDLNNSIARDNIINDSLKLQRIKDNVK